PSLLASSPAMILNHNRSKKGIPRRFSLRLTDSNLMARVKMAGRGIGKADGYIAATAASRGLMVATRDVSPFEAAGLTVLNPWRAAR
ncbi:PIN domain-containing protein, partial [Sinorhizobium medicae]